MTSKSVLSLAFTAGCVLALGAMSSAQAQSYSQAYPAPQPQIQMPAYSGAPRMQAYDEPRTQPYAAPQTQAYAGPTPAAEPYELPPRMVTNGPQASRGDFGDWSARQNNIESAHYDRLLEVSPGFRVARMRKECGPINDPQLHEQCMASFQQYEPTMYGSSIAPRRYRYQQRYGY